MNNSPLIIDERQQNHFTPMRQSLYDQFSLCRYNIPTTVAGEMDVTKFESLTRNGSRTAHYVQAISRCLKQHPRVNAGFVRNFWSNTSRIVHWNTVDASVAVDRKFEGDRFPFFYVIRNSDRLTIKQIDEEIRYATEAKVEDVPAFANYLRFLKLPRIARKMLLHQMICNPEIMKSRIGTFSLTNLSFWGFNNASLGTSRLLVGVGAPKNNQLPIGYSFNHVITDGAQIGEFHRDMKRFFRKCEFE